MIRLLRKEELGRIHKLGAQFFALAKRPGTYNPEAVERLWNALFDQDLALFLIAEQDGELVGVFGAIVHEDYFSGMKTATECFWFVAPEARGSIGLRLFYAFEAEAKRRGAERFLMVHLNNLTPDSLAKLYERRGYKAIETSYEKVEI